MQYNGMITPCNIMKSALGDNSWIAHSVDGTKTSHRTSWEYIAIRPGAIARF